LKGSQHAFFSSGRDYREKRRGKGKKRVRRKVNKASKEREYNKKKVAALERSKWGTKPHGGNPPDPARGVSTRDNAREMGDRGKKGGEVRGI